MGFKQQKKMKGKIKQFIAQRKQHHEMRKMKHVNKEQQNRTKKKKKKWKTKAKPVCNNDSSVLEYEPLLDIGAQREHLPIFSVRAELIEHIRKKPTTIIIGETGSGKTTQIPQYLYEAGLAKARIIACTQPRRVAAMSISNRVSEECGCQLGDVVGYSVRFDDCTSANTKIKYMTDGMLLREAISDPMLSRYSVIILDEAHERTVQTDVLFGVVKAAQRKRRRMFRKFKQNKQKSKGKKKKKWKPLKVVVMSATMDVDHFSGYFNSAPVLYVEGRQHPVTVMYAKERQSDYMFSALVTIFQIHRDAPANEDILVFLTGQEEIESTVKVCRQIASSLQEQQHHPHHPLPRLIVCPLYAAMPPSQQMQVFAATPRGQRKVIVSTNIAETSVTIPGIVHVIDCGHVKVKTHSSAGGVRAGGGVDTLHVEPTSQAAAWQRAGRAGRSAPGTCYRLYTRRWYLTGMSRHQAPDITRCNLTAVTLQLLAMGLSHQHIFEFDFMDKPEPRLMEDASEQLVLLQAITDNTHELTDVGRQMSVFPIDPCLAKVILCAVEHHCLEEVLSIVSVLSVDSIVYTPSNKKDAALAARTKFVSSQGDHITLLNMFRAFRSNRSNMAWCHSHFLHTRNLNTAESIRHQLRDLCVKHNLPLHSCGRDFTNIRKCFASGMFMNSAELQRDGTYLCLSSRQKVAIHPTSVLFASKPQYLIYNELVKTSQCYMRNVVCVDAQWLYDASPGYFRRHLKTAIL